MKNVLLNMAAMMGSVLLFSVILFFVMRVEMEMPSGFVTMFLYFVVLGKMYPAFFQLLPFSPSGGLLCYATAVVMLIGNEAAYVYLYCLPMRSDPYVNGYFTFHLFVEHVVFALVPMTLVFLAVRAVTHYHEWWNSDVVYAIRTKCQKLLAAPVPPSPPPPAAADPWASPVITKGRTGRGHE
ncbi:MAG: hypothetical protein ACAI35_18510 [Candidatus Methylacidiphilales bacterium]